MITRDSGLGYVFVLVGGVPHKLHRCADCGRLMYDRHTFLVYRESLFMAGCNPDSGATYGPDEHICYFCNWLNDLDSPISAWVV